MHRSTHAKIALAVGLVGVAAFAHVLVATLGPNARTDAELPRVRTNDIAPGAFRFVPHLIESAPPWHGETLFVRDASGKLHAWHVPGQGTARKLPDGNWWKDGRPCSDLRPAFPEGVISCHDQGMDPPIRERYRWTVHGKSLNQWVPDLEPAAGVEEDGHFVYHKLRRAA